jgi:Holliday junction DNA helicase RuvB
MEKGTVKNINPVVPVAKETKDAEFIDSTLRPRRLAEFIGQDHIKKNLDISIQAASKRNDPLDHILLYGPPGLGKTTLAHIIAHETNKHIHSTSGPAIERAGDLAAILTNLQDDDILFVDEIHRLPKIVEEILYPALEDFNIDIIVGKGPSARTLKLDVPRFTLIGATTRLSLISSPLRDRFGMIHRLNFYDNTDIELILNRSSSILKTTLEIDAARLLAERSRKTPRIANRLLKRARDYADVLGTGVVTLESAEKALSLLNIDALGLDDLDRKILQTIIQGFNGGPVGVQAIAASLSEEEATIVEIYEPFLMQIGFLARTPRGRIATEAAYRHIGIVMPMQKTLL